MKNVDDDDDDGSSSSGGDDDDDDDVTIENSMTGTRARGIEPVLTFGGRRHKDRC